MSSEEFGGIGFAPGVVRGVRSFDVDKLGRLIGVTHAQVWTPVENYAVCLKPPPPKKASSGGVVHAGGPMTFTYTMSLGGLWIDDEPKKSLPAPTEAVEATHTLADCGHGFYAYYDGSDDYGKDSRVSGVIEGYGETVIGTRGFRSMKARIVALTVKDDIRSPLATRLRVNYSTIQFFDTFDDMVAEFPADTALMSPESDPEFWTRTA